MNLIVNTCFVLTVNLFYCPGFISFVSDRFPRNDSKHCLQILKWEISTLLKSEENVFIFVVL